MGSSAHNRRPSQRIRPAAGLAQECYYLLVVKHHQGPPSPYRHSGNPEILDIQDIPEILFSYSNTLNPERKAFGGAGDVKPEPPIGDAPDVQE